MAGHTRLQLCGPFRRATVVEDTSQLRAGLGLEVAGTDRSSAIH